ncbi:sugar kinase [Tateyamaria pelophila]|uniref:sugar kinase n=1 Tax=Tateyamaria pelophila TaxID=328415 RepID=UPI001CBE3735|nr:sugar kinase [Tateyamaria pelophila]
MKVAAIGEAMIELSMDGDTAAVGVAGDTLNSAIYLKRSAPDIQVDYVTRLGAEPFSRKIHDFIAAQDVGTGAIETDPDGTPGLYAITTDASGERSFTYWRDRAAARSVFTGPGGPDFSVLEGYDVVYLSGISLAILPEQTRGALMNWLGGFREGGGRVVYDSNYRPRLWQDKATAQAVNAAMWALSDIALPSIDDEQAITGESADAVAARFVAMGKTGALKRGPSGPLCLATGTFGDYVPALRVVDTTAAGDSFNGAYLGAVLSGLDQAAALQAGHDLAARVVGHKGAILPA